MKRGEHITVLNDRGSTVAIYIYIFNKYSVPSTNSADYYI